MLAGGVFFYTTYMGQLIFAEDLNKSGHVDWYVAEAWYNTTSRTYVYNLPNSSFPSSVAIHYEKLDGHTKVAIRRFIEESVVGCVIRSYVDKSYWKDTDSYNGGYQISNMWHIFYFENEESATAFKLRFGEYISEVTNEHPRYRNQ